MDTVTAGGAEIPALGFGTWPMEGEQCYRAVTTALEAGYWHVDTAQMYDNEAAVGRAIADASVEREELFLVTKLLRRNLGREDVLESTRASLDRLGTDYVDLLLIHTPSRNVPISETVGAMNELQTEGAVEHVGVSNFSVDQLREAMVASGTPIVTNQVEYHPFEDRGDLLEFCIDNGVALTAYSPVAKGRAAEHEGLREIGDRYGKTAAQVALRWLVQQEMVAAIPKAEDPDHIAENIDIFDFELTDGEMAELFELQGGLAGRLRRRLGL